MSWLPTFGGRDGARLVVRALALFPVFGASNVAAETVLSVDGGVSTRVSSNPFLQSQGDRAAVSVSGVLSPLLSIREPRGTLSLGGSVRHTEYTRRYGSTDAVNASLNSDWRPNARLSLTGNVGYDNSIVGENQRFRDDITTLPPIDDFTLSGLRVRSETISGNLGLAYQASARSTVNASAFASLSSVGQSILPTSDYAFYGGRLGYSRTLNARTTVGVAGVVQRYQCRSGPPCTTTTVQPEVTFSLALAQNWSLQGSVGASITRSRFSGVATNSTTAAGNLSLCRRAGRLELCLQGSRSVQPTTTFGARPSTSIGGSARYRLSSRSDLAVDVGYSSSSGGALQGGDITYWNAQASYTRQIARNVGLVVGAGYNRSDDIFIGNRSNFEGSVGLNFSLGRRP